MTESGHSSGGTDRNAEHFVLCSGGKDSTAATHYTMTQILDGLQKNPVVVYLDTTTGIEDNRRYVEALCDEYGWHMWSLRTNVNYDDLVQKYGFPGPSEHNMMYNRLKERQLSKLATVCDGKPRFWTGVRKSESRRRMAYMEETREEKRWIWKAPIIDWDDQDCLNYIKENDIPRNSEIWDTLGKSGDCWCGAFRAREDFVIDAAAEYPDHYEWLKEVEGSVDRDGAKGLWAWASLDQKEQRAIDMRDDDEQMHFDETGLLCSSCEIGGVDNYQSQGGEPDD